MSYTLRVCCMLPFIASLGCGIAGIVPPIVCLALCMASMIPVTTCIAEERKP